MASSADTATFQLFSAPATGNLRRFLTQETSVVRGRVIFMALLAGAASALMLGLLNVAADQVSQSEVESRLFVAYLVAFTLFLYTQRLSMREATAAVERTIEQVRLRLTDKVRRAPLRLVEQAGGIGGFSALIHDTQLIATSGQLVVGTFGSLSILSFSFVYLAWLSPLICGTVVAVVASYMVIYRWRSGTTAGYLQSANAKEGDFLRGFGDLLGGFKELQMSRSQRDALGHRLRGLTEQARDLKLQANERQLFDYTFGSTALYLLLLLVVFLLPIALPGGDSKLHQAVATILYILGPIGVVTNALGGLAAVDASVGRLYALEAQLDAAAEPQAPAPDAVTATFQKVRLDGLTFRYLDADATTMFTSGPHHLDIVAGELLFLVGGNGTGKSTFLKLLTGLYPGSTGSLLWDERVVDAAVLEQYRALYAIVLADFHLFPRLYGVSDVSDEHVNAWLARLGLADKTRCVAGRFTHTDLSTGQRKRLAFLAAVLEGRPICIFDEVASDQDPDFRRLFYEDILPSLKAQGRTVIVVSHDDAYFHVADRILRLDAGAIVADERPTHHPPDPAAAHPP